MRKLAILAAASLAATALTTAANAQETFDAIGDAALIGFGGTVPGTSSTLQLTLTGLDSATGLFTFSYTLTNTSDPATNGSSRVVSFGFEDVGVSTTVGDASGDLSELLFGANISGGSNFVDVCVTTNNCSGGGGGGATLSNDAVGSFFLDYTGSLSSLTLDNFIVRYQSTFPNAEGSGIGFPNGNPIPEPATWAMMLIGFGATGIAIRRSRRRKDLIAQIA